MGVEMNVYTLDPPPDVTVKDLTDLFVLLQPHIDKKLFMQAPENVKRMFKLSIFSASPSNMLN